RRRHLSLGHLLSSLPAPCVAPLRHAALKGNAHILSIEDVVLTVYPVVQDIVMLSRKALFATRTLVVVPNDFIDEVLLPKHLVQGKSHVAVYSPVTMHEDTSIARQ